MALTVTTPFADYAVGDRITDAKECDAVLASDAARFVVRVSNEPAPAVAAEPAKES